MKQTLSDECISWYCRRQTKFEQVMAGQEGVLNFVCWENGSFWHKGRIHICELDAIKLPLVSKNCTTITP